MSSSVAAGSANSEGEQVNKTELRALIDSAFDGTITPLAVGFGLAGLLTTLGLWWAHSATREPTDEMPPPEPSLTRETVEPGY